MPSVMTLDLADSCNGYITSVVLGADVIPRLSCHSVERLLLQLVESSLAKKVMSSTSTTLNSLSAALARFTTSSNREWLVTGG